MDVFLDTKQREAYRNRVKLYGSVNNLRKKSKEKGIYSGQEDASLTYKGHPMQKYPKKPYELPDVVFIEKEMEYFTYSIFWNNVEIAIALTNKDKYIEDVLNKINFKPFVKKGHLVLQNNSTVVIDTLWVNKARDSSLLKSRYLIGTIDRKSGKITKYRPLTLNELCAGTDDVNNIKTILYGHNQVSWLGMYRNDKLFYALSDREIYFLTRAYGNFHNLKFSDKFLSEWFEKNGAIKEDFKQVYEDVFNETLVNAKDDIKKGKLPKETDPLVETSWRLDPDTLYQKWKDSEKVLEK